MKLTNNHLLKPNLTINKLPALWCRQFILKLSKWLVTITRQIYYLCKELNFFRFKWYKKFFFLILSWAVIILNIVEIHFITINTVLLSNSNINYRDSNHDSLLTNAFTFKAMHSIWSRLSFKFWSFTTPFIYFEWYFQYE